MAGYQASLTLAQGDARYLLQGEAVPASLSPKAAISTSGNSSATSLATQNTWVQVTEPTWADEVSREGLSADGANNRIKALTSESYNSSTEVEWSVCFSGSASSTFEVGISIDGGSSIETPVLARVLGAGGDVGSASMQTILAIDASAADKLITLWARCTSANTKTITVTEGYLEAKEA